MISPSKLALVALLALACPDGMAAVDGVLADGDPVAPPKAAGDTAVTLHRWDFDADAGGWQPEQDAEYQPWSSCARVEGGFLGSKGALRTTGVNHWGSVGSLVTCAYPGTDTKITWAYRAHGCRDITAQGRVPAAKKQLHGTATTFRPDAWTVDTLQVERWNHWDGGDLVGKGHDFATLMIFASAAKAADSVELLIDDVVVWQGSDRTPPDRVRSAAAVIDQASGDVVLSWRPPTDNVAVARIAVHRSILGDSTPDSGNRIGEISDVRFRDGGIANFGAYFYRFVAIDASGNEAEASMPLRIAVLEQP
jgi:hypothetical protein